MRIYSETAVCNRWGARKGARLVTHLTPEERAAIRAGAEIYLTGAPEYQGQADRRIIEQNGRFYARMPASTFPKTRANGVIELDPKDPAATVCGHCGRGWDDTVSTGWTPAPGGRCPFEYEHR